MNDKSASTNDVDIFKWVDRHDPKGRLPDKAQLGLPRLPEVSSINVNRSRLGHRSKYRTRGSTEQE